MRAKTINEIRQEISGSGLGAIGTGKAGVLKLYTKFNRRWPEWFNPDAEKLSEIFQRLIDKSKLEKTKERLNYYKEVFEEYSDTSLDDFICVNIYEHAMHKFTETDELCFDMGFNFDDAYEMFDEERDNGVKIIFSSKLDYLRKDGVGMIYINLAEKPYDQITHCIFVKYK
jgi:hypothetical protein